MKVHQTWLLRNPALGDNHYRVDTNRNLKADADEPVLVRNTEDGWKPVDSIEADIDRFKVGDLAMWVDREISHKEGWLPPRKVVDRPKDGQVDADELDGFAWGRLGSSNTFYLGAEVIKAGDRGLLQEQTYSFGPYRIIGEGDLQRMNAIRMNDDHWMVGTYLSEDPKE